MALVWVFDEPIQVNVFRSIFESFMVPFTIERNAYINFRDEMYFNLLIISDLVFFDGFEKLNYQLTIQ